jgi:hypothetical protein
MGVIAMRVAFARRKRWNNPIRMPDVKSDTSAILDVVSVFMKSFRCAWT